MSKITKKANKLFITSTIVGETLQNTLPYLANKGAIKDDKGNETYRMAITPGEYGSVNTKGVIFNAVDKDGFATVVINIDEAMTAEDIARVYSPAKTALDKAEETIKAEIEAFETNTAALAAEITVE